MSRATPTARHVVVVGAGIVGAATAHALSRAGWRVTVLEAGDAPASGASRANGAQLSYSYVEPLASPATLRKLPSLLLDPDSPLKLRITGEWAQVRWGWRFLLACRSRRVAQTTAALLQLAECSRQELARLCPVADDAFAHHQPGKLVLCDSEAALDAARRQVAQQAQWGCVQSVLSPAACVQREPALAPYAGQFVGGVWTATEAVGDCHRLTLALLAASEAQGAQVHLNRPVTGWSRVGHGVAAAHTPQGPVAADAFVLANGADAPALARPLGLRLPLYPIKGYSITLPVTDPQRAPRVSVTDLRRKLVYARLGDTLRVAGMAELVGHDRRIDPARIEFLRRSVAETFPGAVDTHADPQAWAGLRPATPTGMPLIGQVGPHNLFVNLGHGALGWTLAMGSARVLADAVAATPNALGALFAPQAFI